MIDQGTAREHIPVPESARLGLDDDGEIHRTGEQQHGDNDKANRDFIGDHLGR